MNRQISFILRITVTVLFLFAYLFGCVPHTVSKKKDEKPPAVKRITAVTVEEDADAVYVWVKGSGLLTYTSVKQPFPLRVILYFPETIFEDTVSTVEPESDLIGTIQTSKIEAEAPTSRIEIALKQDLPYEVDRDGSNLKISFKKSVVAEVQETVEDKPMLKDRQEPLSVSKETDIMKPIKPATTFDSVSFEKLEESVIISVNADGEIRDYNAFTIESPSRIVLDLYNLKSPKRKEKHVAVDTKWVKRIRYYGYPDRFRLVVDTTKQHLSSYRATPFQNGIQIKVGGAKDEVKKEKAVVSEKPSVVETKTELVSEKVKDTAVTKKTETIEAARTAWVNRIDFTSEAEGKSIILIQTTRPVEYHLQKIAEKQLQLKLFHTRLPDYRQRPLITTRFESAVDRITPFHTPVSKDTALFSIELREEVPFMVKQSDKLIQINFEASSIQPRSFEEAKLPTWKKVLAQAAEDLQVQEPKPEQEAQPKIKDTETPPVSDTKESATEKQPSKVTDEKIAKTIKEEEIVKQKISPERDYDIDRQKVADEYTGEQKSLDLYREETLKKYTGEKIALDFYETDIKNVIRILREIGKQNFAIDRDVSGKVTLSFENPVPWDQVLDLVLKMNQLGKIYEGDIIRIAKLTTLRDEEEQRKLKLKEKREAEEQVDLVTAFISLSYANAKDVQTTHIGVTIDSVPSILTGRGKTSVEERINTLVITDIPSVIKRAKEIIQRIDKVPPQVLIEARVVEATSSFSREIGTQWDVTGGPVFTREIGNGLIPEGELDYNISATNPPQQSLGQIGINFSKLTGTPFEIMNAQLLAAESKGDVKIISSPSILTLDATEAEIMQGTTVPVPILDDSGNTTIDYRDVVLRLVVTPHVTPDNRISMTITISKNELGAIINNNQSFTTKEAKTELIINDSDTVVIGGIRKSRKETGEAGVPGLMKIPFLSWLFKRSSQSEDLDELLIFITPKIIKLEQRG